MNNLIEVESIETSTPHIRIFKIGKILYVTVINLNTKHGSIIFTIPSHIKILTTTVFAAVNFEGSSSEIEINIDGTIKIYGNANSVSGTGIVFIK